MNWPGKMKHGPNVLAWIVDQKCLDDLISYVQAEHHRTVLDLPKVTAFAENTVMITTRGGDPISRRYLIGSVVKVTGSILVGSTKLTVDLRLLPLEDIAGPESKKQTADINFSGTATLSDKTDERLRRIMCEVPDGSSLVISLGPPLLRRRIDAAATDVVRPRTQRGGGGGGGPDQASRETAAVSDHAEIDRV